MIQTFSAKINFILGFSSVQLLSCVRLFATPQMAARQASLSIANFWSLLKLMSIETVMPPNHLILCLPFSPCLRSLPASGSFQMSWCGSRGCVAWERLRGDTPCPRAEKPQQDGRRWSGGGVAGERLCGDTPHPRTKETPQQDGRRGKTAFRIKPRTGQKHSEGSNKPVRTRTQRPHRDWDRTVLGHKIKVTNMAKQKRSVLKLSNLSKVTHSSCILNASAPTFIHQPHSCPWNIFPSKGRRDVVHNISTKEN